MGKPRQASGGAEFFKPKSSKGHSMGSSAERAPMESSGYTKGETAILESIQTLHNNVDRMESRMLALEENLTSLQNRVTVMEGKNTKVEETLVAQGESINKMTEEQSKIHKLTDTMMMGQMRMERKVESLEDAVRANNIRILGIPATEEGDDLVSFLGKFLSEILEIEEGRDPPLVIKAFRLPSRSKKWSDNGGGTVLTVLADVAERDRLLDLARRKKELLYKGQRILIFPDVGPASQERRVQLLALRKELLQKGFSASLLYPAKLKVRTSDRTFVFCDAQEVRDFLDKNSCRCSIVRLMFV